MAIKTITNGAAKLLENLAAVPGLCTAPADLYRVGKAVDENIVLDPPERPRFDNPQMPTEADLAKAKRYDTDMKAWINLDCQYEVSEKQQESIKTFLKTAIEKGALPATKPAFVLMDAFGLAPQD